jgi:hypothetical protein
MAAAAVAPGIKVKRIPCHVGVSSRFLLRTSSHRCHPRMRAVFMYVGARSGGGETSVAGNADVIRKRDSPPQFRVYVFRFWGLG